MTGVEPKNAISHRLARLAEKLRNKAYRDSYLASHTKIFLANQITALRGEASQEEFGKMLNKPQSVVSRLQNPNYGRYTLQTLLDIASKLDIALVVRFVDYPTFLRFTSDFSDHAVRPKPFSPHEVDKMVEAACYDAVPFRYEFKTQVQQINIIEKALSGVPGPGPGILGAVPRSRFGSEQKRGFN